LGYSQTSRENSWETKQPIAQSLSASGAVVVNDEIYLFEKNNIYLYDPELGNYTQKTTIPTSRSSFFTSVIGNKIYVMGGQSKTTPSYPSTVNEVYNVLTGTWETKQPLPLTMGEVDANVVDGKIYVIGAGNSTIVTEVYDPQSDTWTDKTSPPTILSRYYSCVIDEKIYIVNDVNVHWITDKLPHEGKMYIYNTKADSWSNGTSIPQFYQGSAIAATTGSYAPKYIYIMGGCVVLEFSKTRVVNATFMYNPANDSWTRAADMLTARSHFASATIKDKLYAIGGSLDVNSVNGNPSYAVEVFTPFGYGTVQSTIDDSQPFLTETTALIAGVVVAATVVAVAGVIVFHFKHVPVKVSKSS
jgi:N-acetylneuraminic acid mutarotase